MSIAEKIMIQSYVSRILKSQVDYLVTQIQGIQIENDCEFLHHTRVMSRRIRNTLEVFSPYLGKKHLKKWIPAFRLVTKKLTKTRDLDVQILFLERELSALVDQKNLQGLNRILLRKKQERIASQKNIGKDIEKFQKSGVLDEIAEFINEHPFQAENFFPTESLCNLAVQEIESNIKECFLYVPFISNPANKKELHNLRIAIKNLRYVVELFEYIYPNLREHLDILKLFQDDLGKIHDCDIWLNDLEKFERKEAERMLKFYGQVGPYNFVKPGIDYLNLEISTIRMQTFDQFIQSWNFHFQNQFWALLRDQLIIYPPYDENEAAFRMSENEGEELI